MEQLKALLRQNFVKTSDQTFLGTGIHAPKKVCHGRGFLGMRENDWVVATTLHLDGPPTPTRGAGRFPCASNCCRPGVAS
jgi:hypothetical protein